MLHALNPDLDVRCITVSGSMYPYSVLTHYCDPYLISDMLHAHNPDLDVRCITDSGSMYPYSVHTHNCDPYLIEYAAFEVTDLVFNYTIIVDKHHCLFFVI